MAHVEPSLAVSCVAERPATGLRRGDAALDDLPDLTVVGRPPALDRLIPEKRAGVVLARGHGGCGAREHDGRRRRIERPRVERPSELALAVVAPARDAAFGHEPRSRRSRRARGPGRHRGPSEGERSIAPGGALPSAGSPIPRHAVGVAAPAQDAGVGPRSARGPEAAAVSAGRDLRHPCEAGDGGRAWVSARERRARRRSAPEPSSPEAFWPQQRTV